MRVKSNLLAPLTRKSSWMMRAMRAECGCSPSNSKPTGNTPLTEEQARFIEETQARLARRLSTDELGTRAKRAKKQPSVRTAQVSVFVRDAAVAEYARRLANGLCDLCEQRAPFQNKSNEAYLECHHIIWLAQGGEDAIANTVALCPNCHRKMHVLNTKADKQKLTKLATGRANNIS